MEILGLEPKLTICKIAVLPIKLYPLNFYTNIYLQYNINIYFFFNLLLLNATPMNIIIYTLKINNK